MAAKLTITVDSKMADFMKKFVKKNNTSISAIISGFIDRLQYIEDRAKTEPVHPLVKKHAGSLTGQPQDRL